MADSLLDGVLTVSRELRASAALDETLQLLVEAVVDVLGFGAAAINVLAPDGDLRVEAVVGPPAAQKLLGTRCSAQQWSEALSACEQWGELYFHGHDFDQDVFRGVASWSPAGPAGQEPDAWDPGDSLFAPLRDADRRLIGVISVDQPNGGRRPDSEQCIALELFAAHAARAVADAASRAEIEAGRDAAESRWRLAFEHNPTAAAIISTDGSVLEVNQALCSLLGYTETDLGRKNFADITHPEDLRNDQGLFARLVDGACNTYATEKRYLRSDGSIIDGLLHVGAIRDHAGTVRTIIAQVSDITERTQAQARLAYEQSYDVLTGLPNHATISTALAAVLAGGEGAAVLFCDIDWFKAINRALGRPVGDRLLQGAARRLEELLTDGCRLARVGDDEFLVLAPGCTELRDVEALSDQIMAGMRRPLSVDGEEYTLSLSIGAATATSRATDSDDLIADAEHALRRAKRDGRARSEHYDPDLDGPSSLVDLHLTQQLRKAIDSLDGIELHLQPIVALADETVIGAEALMRWRHPTRGLLAPEAFLPMAEHAGLISDLGWQALSLAAQIVAHPSRDLPDTGWISVNVSASQLARGKLPTILRSVLAANDVAPSLLRLEITETALANASQLAISELHEVAEMGVSIGLDDFGTGYSSLSLLRDLPIDVVKIDRSFIAPIADNPRTAVLVRGVVSMCKELGVSTVAEGVETERQLAFVRGLGCDQAQGYLFGRPQMHRVR